MQPVLRDKAGEEVQLRRRHQDDGIQMAQPGAVKHLCRHSGWLMKSCHCADLRQTIPDQQG